MPTPRHWVEFADDWRHAPMAYWVHAEQEGTSWRSAQRYAPEAPTSIPHKGFAVLCVQVGDVVLRFSSRAQLEECIRVLSMKPLPTSKRLSALRGTGAGPNKHWLSRLPARIKSPDGRRRVVEALMAARAASPF